MPIRFKYVAFLFVFLLSCNKYKYSKPCSVNLKAEFESADPDSELNTSVNLSVERLTFSGERTKAGPVEIEKELNGASYKLENEQALGLSMDIPIGSYSNYTFKLRLSPENSFHLNRKNYKNFQPIIVTFKSDIDLEFNSSAISPELEKNKAYDVSLLFDVDALFSGITDEDLENAITPGNNAIVIHENKNSNLLQIIKSNLVKSLSVKINE